MIMNTDLITLNEVLNNGESVYFYQEPMTGSWVTYGYSAFQLSQMNGISSIASFSEKMQMPCVCITEATFRGIVKENMKTIECKDGYYLLPTKAQVDDDAYQKWVTSLK